MDKNLLQIRRQAVLFDKKWKIFLKRARLFAYAPFVDFVLAAGSMALGDVLPDSDFDVITAVRYGRIFTARFFCVLFFGFFGWRRKKISHQETAANKICFNHFITSRSFRLSPPYNLYWQQLYSNLVPIFGKLELINYFFAANKDWMGKTRVYNDDLRHFSQKPRFIKRVLEKLLCGRFGNLIETILKIIQIQKIKRGLKTNPPGYKPRIKYDDSELEFHPDTYRLEYLKNKLYNPQ